MSEKLNRHNDPTWLLGAARAAQGSTSLSDIHVVDGILRAFTMRVLDRHNRVGVGKLTPDEAANADRADCLATAAIFAGETDVYHVVEGWNGAGLAASLRAQMAIPAGTSDKDAIVEAFGHFTLHIYDCLRQFGEDAGEEAMQEGLSENVRSFAWALMGLQSHA